MGTDTNNKKKHSIGTQSLTLCISECRERETIARVEESRRNKNKTRIIRIIIIKYKYVQNIIQSNILKKMLE